MTITTTQSTFKLCTCGGSEFYHVEYTAMKNRQHQIECKRCGRKTTQRKTVAAAVNEWNAMNRENER